MTSVACFNKLTNNQQQTTIVACLLYNVCTVCKVCIYTIKECRFCFVVVVVVVVAAAAAAVLYSNGEVHEMRSKSDSNLAIWNLIC